MNLCNTLDVLSEQVDMNICTIKKKATSNKRMFKIMVFLSVMLGAITTFILGVDIVGYEKIQKNIALFISFLLTIVSGWSAKFDYQKLWFRQKVTLLHLYQLQNEIKFLKSKNITDGKMIDNLFISYQEIWNNDCLEWSNIYRPLKQEENE